MTTDQITLIEKPPHGTLEWLMNRHRDHLGRCTLGASDAPALMHASPFTSRADLYHSKRTTPKISEPTAAMHVGNILEAPLVSELGRRLGIEMITPNTMYRRDRFTVTLDAIGVGTDTTPAVIGEVKTTRKHRITDISDVPHDYLWQCWAQMLVLDRPVWLIVLDRDMSISTHEIPRNEQALDTLRIDSEKFCAAVDGDDERELTLLIDEMSAEQIADIVKPIERTVELTTEQYEWVRELADARDLKRQAETIEQAARDHIARFMLDGTIATYDSRKVLTWKQQAGRDSFDLARLRADHPELVAAYTRQGQPSRVMRLSNTKGNN
jgi:predicted phage-related endonuclease